MKITPTLEVRDREENYININPIQSAGRLTPAARKALIAYGDGYSACDNCIKPFRLDCINKPPISEFCKDIAQFVNMDVARVMPGARRGFQAVAQSLLKAGDVALVTAAAHYSLCLAIEGAGATWKEIPLNSGNIATPEAAEAKIQEVKRSTGQLPKLIAICHFDYFRGNEHDVYGIAKVAQNYGIPFLYNGAYTVGVMPVNGKEMGVDFVIGSGHKSMASPAPTGVLATSTKFADIVFRTTAMLGDITGRKFGIKEVELLGCTVMGAPLMAMMASFDTVKKRVNNWNEEVEKSNYFINQLLRIEGTRVGSEMPRKHTMTKVDTTGSFDKVARKHKQGGYFLYEALRRRGIVGGFPGATREWKLGTYGLSWDQIKHLGNSFIEIAEENGLSIARDVDTDLPHNETHTEINTVYLRHERTPMIKRGISHPVCDLNQRLREIFLDLGFNEVINPAIVPDEEVYKQYGPEACLILDRVYYIAGLPRPDIGISDKEWEKVQLLAPTIPSREALADLFRDYKKGLIESDDLIQEVVSRLKIEEHQAIRVLDEAFPQLKNMEPIPTRKTLRSHMTSLWFPLLAKAQHMETLPLRLFSIGARFRREQREDPRHLFESTTASIVVMDDGFSLEDGKELTRNILSRLGFEDCWFKPKAVTSNYYEQETDTEVYARFEGKDLEIANIGFYAALPLGKYGITHRVFNVGFGVERLAMIFQKAADIRQLVYPYFYGQEEFGDDDITQALKVSRRPATHEGEVIVKALVNIAHANEETIGIKELLAYEGKLINATVNVYFYNWDEGRPMLGPAAMNEIVVHNGNIYAVPQNDKDLAPAVQEAFTLGRRTGLTLIDLLLQGAVASLEEVVRKGETEFDERFKMIKGFAQVNVDIPENIREWIRGQHKAIQLGGPVFSGVKVKIVYN